MAYHTVAKSTRRGDTARLTRRACALGLPGTLDASELNDLAAADNMPLTVCTSLSMTLNEIKLDTSQSGNLMLWCALCHATAV